MRVVSVFLLGVVALLAGCGYHTLGSAAHLPPAVHIVAVPIFKNQTQYYHTEVAMTQAVVRELTDRTRLAITADSDDGDATVRGTIISESVQPLTYRTQTTSTATSPTNSDGAKVPPCPLEPARLRCPPPGQKTSVTSSFLVTVNVNVLVTDRDNRILYQHTNYVFHEQFETTTDLTSFIQEDSPAVQRLSRDFAQALVSDILESF
jgi:outer membrane lipopolysaccharide assembly protein LptE/RlpB